jgi:hypothetical protein
MASPKHTRDSASDSDEPATKKARVASPTAAKIYVVARVHADRDLDVLGAFLSEMDANVCLREAKATDADNGYGSVSESDEMDPDDRPPRYFLCHLSLDYKK